MTVRELLAIVLGGDAAGKHGAIATRLLDRSGRSLTKTNRERALFCALHDGGEAAVIHDLHGLDASGRARLEAVFELARRYAQFRDAEVRSIDGVGDVRLNALEKFALAQVPKSLRVAPKEWIGFVPLYQTGKLGEFCLVERGVRTHVNFDPRELFVRVLSLRAVAFFLVHNHPSGLLSASREDHRLTAEVARIGRSLGVELAGHWVVTAGGQKRV